MAENHISTRPSITRKPHRYQPDEDLIARFICHANSTHVLQSSWRGLDVGVGGELHLAGIVGDVERGRVVRVVAVIEGDLLDFEKRPCEDEGLFLYGTANKAANRHLW